MARKLLDFFHSVKDMLRTQGYLIKAKIFQLALEMIMILTKQTEFAIKSFQLLNLPTKPINRRAAILSILNFN